MSKSWELMRVAPVLTAVTGQGTTHTEVGRMTHKSVGCMELNRIDVQKRIAELEHVQHRVAPKNAGK